MSECTMKRRSILRKFLPELVLIWMILGTVSASTNDSSTFYKFTSSNVGKALAELTLVGLQAVSDSATRSAAARSTVTKAKVLTNETTTVSPQKEEIAVAETNRAGRAITNVFLKRSSPGLPQKQTTASNALLANIDFLTQLTNSKQGKSEMDPLKCFPKALCGLSAESAAITRRRKNNLITDYIRLMKAVALNPSVMARTLKKLDQREDLAQDDQGEDSDSDEDGEDDEEEEDDRRRSKQSVNRRSAYGYGYDSLHTEQTPVALPSKKRTKRKETIPKNSEEFTKQFLQERAYVEKLMDDGYNNEDTDATNWWAYEKEQQDPSLEELVDDSGTKLDSSSVEKYYTFGSKRKPRPPTAPHRPEAPQLPPAPQEPLMSPPGAPPLPRPPPTPHVRMPENIHDNYGSSSSGVSSIGNFFRSLLGFGSSSGDAASFARDPFFQGFKRSMPDGTPTLVTVDKTKEILTTAIEIGETLRSPNQCNTLFNGCQYQYIELLHVIDDIRSSLADKGRDGEKTSLLGDEEDTEADDGSSYGYKTSLSKVSQAETLSPDYTAASAKITGKNKRKSRKQKKKKSSSSTRDGKLSSMSKESSVEIGSDEPTLYGSGQENFDFVRRGKHGLHSHNPHHHYQQQQHRYPHRQGSSSSNPYQSQQSHYSPYGSHSSYSSYDDMYTRQPKTFWGTILSWFGFRRRK